MRFTDLDTLFGIKEGRPELNYYIEQEHQIDAGI